jgi:sodium transport system permease protein
MTTMTNSRSSMPARGARKPFIHYLGLVFRKEFVDALRDRRTLMRTLLPMLFMGPLMIFALSAFIGSLEERAERREMLVDGIAAAPSLQNYLERQGFTIKTPPADYEELLRKTRLLEAVLRVPADFETRLQAADEPVLQLVSDSGNQRAEISARQIAKALQGFERERVSLSLMLRGIAPELLKPLEVDEVNLAGQQARGAQLTAMIPMLIIMAVLMGALTAALDSTAGERERGSLEPLLMNPVPDLALVGGKWAAVALLGVAVALVAIFSFVPAQLLIRNDELQALFQFGAGEALRSWLLLLPLSASCAAMLMALAIRTKTFKEAQASAGLLVSLFGLTPLIALLNPGGEQGWYLWVPGLAQTTLMNMVIKGDPLLWSKVAPSLGVSAALTLGALALVARSMKQAVAR